MPALDVVDVDVTDDNVNVKDDVVTEELAIVEMIGDRLSMMELVDVVGVAIFNPILAKLNASELFSFPIRLNELDNGGLIT